MVDENACCLIRIVQKILSLNLKQDISIELHINFDESNEGYLPELNSCSSNWT